MIILVIRHGESEADNLNVHEGRAVQTAKHLSDETKLAIEFDPDLMEFNNGLLAGLSREDAERLYPPIENLPIDQAVYGQESMVEFRSRAENVLISALIVLCPVKQADLYIMQRLLPVIISLNLL